MSYSVPRWCVVASFAAMSSLSLAGSGSQDRTQTPARTTFTPGSIALAGSDLDAPALAAIASGIRADAPGVRAVAARLAGVAGHAPFGEALAAAFEREEDSAAAVEQARGLLFIRGADAGRLLERRLYSSDALAIVYAEWIARMQPVRLPELIPRLTSVTGLSAATLNPHVHAALDRQLDGGEALLRAWLKVSTPLGWRAFVDGLQLDGLPSGQHAVLNDALAASDPGLREATVWSIAARLARGRPVAPALLDAAIASTRTTSGTSTPTWEQFGREFIARGHAGRTTPERSALVNAEGHRHYSDAQALAVSDLALEPERKALQVVLGDRFPPERSDPDPTTTRDPAARGMRTFPAFWPGFLESVLETADCRRRREDSIGIVAVTYRPDGRVSDVTVNDATFPAGCNKALTALARLTLADPEYPPTGPTEWLVLPFERNHITCATTSGWVTSTQSPERPADGRIQPPRKTRNVQPIYPASLQEKRVEGRVIIESIISSTGCVPTVRVLRATGPLFGVFALNAVAQWRFTPAKVDDGPVPVMMTVTVNFKLQ